MMKKTIDDQCIDTIRFLAVDAIQKANSGHPGAPMGAAPAADVLWDRFLKHNPSDPTWPNRDRFVLSAGHASALLYALLHLTGYDVSLEDLKAFRQWESKTPGHIEYGTTPGVEVTTGPLGQGFANGVGMAIAERWLAERYNRSGYNVIDHFVYAIVSDGDLMEGVASEAASLAGTLRLSKLIYLYDDNDISIEGHTDLAFTENVAQRFQAYGWHVVGPVDGADLSGIESAIRAAQQETERPSLIICKTIIGCGSPNKAGKASAHGEPLGEEEVCLTRENLKWPYSEPFTVPEEVKNHMRRSLQRGKTWQDEWLKTLNDYTSAYRNEAEQLELHLSGALPEGWDSGLTNLFKPSDKPMATRSASGTILNAIAQKAENLMGGSADLAPSTKTLLKDQGRFAFGEYQGRNIHFGVREHAMGAIANGMSLHGGIIPYTGTFLVFSDYMRPPIRLAAMMGIRVIYIFSHDSIGVGEDGPTHQPVEQLLNLRSIPNLVTIRPADATETAEAWKVALERRNGPTTLILSRQNLPILDHSEVAPASGLQRGGYILWEADSKPDVLIISSGSEVHIALDAGRQLKDKGVAARVVSLPSWELFEAQSNDYRQQVLPPNIKARISIEAGTTLGWDRYIGSQGKAIGVSQFGVSAPAKVIYEKLGLTSNRLVGEALNLLKISKPSQLPGK